jgi:hypothetical protein
MRGSSLTGVGITVGEGVGLSDGADDGVTVGVFVGIPLIPQNMKYYF